MQKYFGIFLYILVCFCMFLNKVEVLHAKCKFTLASSCILLCSVCGLQYWKIIIKVPHVPQAAAALWDPGCLALRMKGVETALAENMGNPAADSNKDLSRTCSSYWSLSSWPHAPQHHPKEAQDEATSWLKTQAKATALFWYILVYTKIFLYVPKCSVFSKTSLSKTSLAWLGISHGMNGNWNFFCSVQYSLRNATPRSQESACNDNNYVLTLYQGPGCQRNAQVELHVFRHVRWHLKGRAQITAREASRHQAIGAGKVSSRELSTGLGLATPGSMKWVEALFSAPPQPRPRVH